MQRLLVATPCLNAGHFLDDTIMSVVTQAGDFAVHYHVQDGGSNDDTRQRLETWSRRLEWRDWPRLCRELTFSYNSEPDAGMYDALDKGFALNGPKLSSDGMMTWINAGDRLAQGALQAVTTVRRTFADAEWIAGSFAQLSDDGCPIAYGSAAAVSRKAIAAGLHDGRRLGFLQQEGVFWSHALWRKIGGRLDPRLKLAGDFDLWRRLADHAPCHALNAVTGFFRRHAGSLSGDARKYFTEIDGLLSGDAAVRRDAVVRELNQFAARNDREGLANAGFLGPVLLWNSETGAWERKMALINIR